MKSDTLPSLGVIETLLIVVGHGVFERRYLKRNSTQTPQWSDFQGLTLGTIAEYIRQHGGKLSQALENQPTGNVRYRYRLEKTSMTGAAFFHKSRKSSESAKKEEVPIQYPATGSRGCSNLFSWSKAFFCQPGIIRHHIAYKIFSKHLFCHGLMVLIVL